MAAGPSVALWALLSCYGVGAFEVNKYLIISAPRLSKIVYMKIGTDKITHVLIDSGLRSPQGLCVDGKRNKLYVADPDAKKIYGYNLLFTAGVLMTDGLQAVAAQNVEARWVAVDGVGSIFFTDERNNMISKVSGDNVLRGDPTPQVLYSSSTVTEVSAPGGIAVDNYHAFWANKIAGTQVGSIERAFEVPPDTDIGTSVTSISSNAAKVYGVCLVNDNVFYTNSETFIYGVKKKGGAIATISDHMIQPRGCTWDEDGTVYVADKGSNGVYEFAGNMHVLTPVRLTKVVDFEDAYGVATVSRASSLLLLGSSSSSVVLLLLLAAVYSLLGQ